MRVWLRRFVADSCDRARDGLRFQPAVRVALDAGEAAALGAIDEAFARLERLTDNPGEPMWWQALIPVVLEILKKWLEKRDPTAPGTVRGAAPAAFCSDVECDQFATQLEQAVAPATARGAQPAGHPSGVIQHFLDLAAAFRARDWAKIQTLLVDLITHL